jgi:hypothetical protein
VTRRARAEATTTGPKRPINISIASQTFAKSGNSEVIPVDKPTVAAAEITSKRRLSKSNFVVALRNTVLTIMTEAYSATNVRA